MKARTEPFVISRVFDARRERVWAAWTEPERLRRWFSPKGFTVLAAKMDLRPGGTYHYGMRMADGREMWGKWLIREVAAPERLIFVDTFSDERGGLTRHPFAPDWPQQMLSTIAFVEQGGRTTLTIHWEPLDATEAELRAFENGRDSMKQGWTGTFEQLVAYLATA